ncbi:selenocysteine-specific translation elongation factor [Bartonella tamiae]|uniref:Selenocysteine-specific elongation factor n=1 Tax=Bartonella tamiae Th239 TaxID=1094558 RepID=J0R7K8_9HYPH|nr:selenocysteine-specific translation elongation factor [Bartonella tamiae]EJF91719.1 selenocysteine-specific translation elongation factor [Bartonella tamiae Th239]EJF92613.1 selenocysteine-specific translation elongation factor [Bartonella tamiae Th307]
MIIGTAGHIDHGKTTLIRALTGVDTDRLLEEKQRGITIELGFAYQTLESGQRIGFVDVPGHEKLIHTMVSGAGSIDFAMLVIAADDGIMPQTREHFEILKLLNIHHGIVVLTRSDLVDEKRLNALRQDVKVFLHNTFLQDAPMIAVSSKTGMGIAKLRAVIEKAAIEKPNLKVTGRFRHVIDRIFTLAGAGTIVTGRVISGQAFENDKLIVGPIHMPIRLRSIHVQDENAQQAQSGDRAALNLVGERVDKTSIKRGMVVLDPFLDHPTMRFDGSVRIVETEKKPLTQWFPVHFHHNAQDISARLVFLDKDSVTAGEKAYCQIVTDKPVIAVVGDRFIIRDTSASRTIGGGEILDPFAPARKRKTPERLAVLKAMEQKDDRTALNDLLKVFPFGIEWIPFCRARNLTEDEAKTVLSSEAFCSFHFGRERFVMTQTHQNILKHKILEYLKDFHDNTPDLFGIGLEKLRRDIAPEIKMPFFRAFLQTEIEAQVLKIQGAWIGLSSHEAKLSDEDEKIFQYVHTNLVGEDRFRPSRTRDFATLLSIDENDMRQILKSASRMGRVYEVAQDYFFPREVLHEIVRQMHTIQLTQSNGFFTAADLRDALHNGRKIAILLLEFFDRHGVTIRKGDRRRLNPHRFNLFNDH